jgi:hypothetical protein
MERRIGAAALAIVFAMFLTGCASGIVVLTNPKTGQTVECKGDGQTIPPAAPIKKCVNAYEQAGYKITGDTR